MHSFHTFLARDAHDAITMKVEAEDLEDRRQPPEQVQGYRRWLLNKR